MAVDLKPGSQDDPERETLRSFLRQWEAPAAPPEIEGELRRTFRRRRARGRRPFWLALAAALALLVVSPLAWKDRPARLTGPEPEPRAVGPHPSPAPSVPLARSVPPPTLPAAEAPRRAHPRPSPQPAAEPEVVVEPGQAELLVRFGERLWDLRAPRTVFSGAPVEVLPAGAPEKPILAVQAAEVPRYQADWERVAGVWPLLQLSAPIMKR